MIIIKMIIYTLIFLTCSFIGILKSQKYADRVKELKEFKTGLNIFKTKINFTYEPIPDIFKQISEKLNSNIGEVFKVATQKMKNVTAGEAWNIAISESILNIEDEDKKVLKGLGNLLGQTDIRGQVNQIELTNNFLDEQISKAITQKEKNERLYRSLGMIIGIAIVIVLV